MRTGGDNLGNALSGGDQASGEDRGQIVAARRVEFPAIHRRNFPDWNGFSGQQRFIHREIYPAAKKSVRRNTVAFGKEDEIAPHDIAPGNAPVYAISNDESPGTRQVSQGV